MTTRTATRGTAIAAALLTAVAWILTGSLAVALTGAAIGAVVLVVTMWRNWNGKRP